MTVGALALREYGSPDSQPNHHKDSTPNSSWMWPTHHTALAKVVVAPIVNAVIAAAAIKTKIGSFLAIVFMLIPGTEITFIRDLFNFIVTL